MGANNYNSLANFVILATVSSSAVSLPYDSNNLMPQKNHNYYFQNSINDLKEMAYNQLTNYQLYNENSEKIQIIIDFTMKIMQNTKDIDSEFVDIVNNNFWELI